MTQDDVYTFHQLMTMLTAFFPHTPINLEVVIEGYFEALAPWSIAQVKAVVDEAIREGDYFPTVHKLREIAEAQRREERHQRQLQEAAEARRQLPHAESEGIPWAEVHELLAKVVDALDMRAERRAPTPEALDPQTLPRRQVFAEQEAQLRAAGLWRPEDGNGHAPPR